MTSSTAPRGLIIAKQYEARQPSWPVDEIQELSPTELAQVAGGSNIMKTLHGAQADPTAVIRKISG